MKRWETEMPITETTRLRIYEKILVPGPRSENGETPTRIWLDYDAANVFLWFEDHDGVRLLAWEHNTRLNRMAAIEKAVEVANRPIPEIKAMPFLYGAGERKG